MSGEQLVGERLISLAEKMANLKTVQRNAARRLRIQATVKKIADINMVLNSSNEEVRKKNDLRIEQEHRLLYMRRQRLNEVYKYVFPIEHVLLIEE
jgi:hypothetical protein